MLINSASAFITPQSLKERKEGKLMLRRFIQWILPLVVLVLIATYMVLSPLVQSHAAAPTMQSSAPTQQIVVPQDPTPDILWPPR
jgi:hypothetical protein